MAKGKSKEQNKAMEDKIKEAFMDYVALEGEYPKTIRKFCQHYKIDESDFYDTYGSFKSIEKDVWVGFFKETRERLESDEAYMEFTAREKVLAFFFTWLEVLKPNRSYILATKEKYGQGKFNLYVMNGFKPHFKEFIDEILMEAKATGEVAERKIIQNTYIHGFWTQLMFVFNYWMKDDSKGFEKTDAAVEKSVNLAFELIGQGALDSLIDFGKFLFKERMA